MLKGSVDDAIVLHIDLSKLCCFAHSIASAKQKKLSECNDHILLHTRPSQNMAPHTKSTIAAPLNRRFLTAIPRSKMLGSVIFVLVIKKLVLITEKKTLFAYTGAKFPRIRSKRTSYSGFSRSAISGFCFLENEKHAISQLSAK